MPGEVDPNSDPPTDALTAGIPGGLSMASLGEMAAERRAVAMRAAPKSEPAATTMWVKPAEGRTILDIDGLPYPVAGMAVPRDDTYAHRRLRDGSLLLSEPVPDWMLMAAQESGADICVITATVATE
jgi:hypothetical protein